MAKSRPRKNKGLFLMTMFIQECISWRQINPFAMMLLFRYSNSFSFHWLLDSCDIRNKSNCAIHIVIIDIVK